MSFGTIDGLLMTCCIRRPPPWITSRAGCCVPILPALMIICDQRFRRYAPRRITDTHGRTRPRLATLRSGSSLRRIASGPLALTCTLTMRSRGSGPWRLSHAEAAVSNATSSNRGHGGRAVGTRSGLGTMWSSTLADRIYQARPCRSGELSKVPSYWYGCSYIVTVSLHVRVRGLGRGFWDSRLDNSQLSSH